MGKLFLILYTGSNLIGGVAGPLPYDLEECQRRASSMQAKADAHPDISKGMKFACEYHVTRPELTEGKPHGD